MMGDSSCRSLSAGEFDIGPRATCTRFASACSTECHELSAPSRASALRAAPAEPVDCTFGPWPCQRAVNLWAGHLRARDLGVAQKQAQEGEGGPPWQRGDGRERVAPMLGTVWPAPGGIITGRLSVIGSHPKVLRPPPARGERWPSGDRSVGAMRGSPYGGGLGGGCSAGDLITRSRRLTEPTNRACCKGSVVPRIPATHRFC